ncbi:MAG: hypothetical protein ACI81T_002052 [Bacteroidia bacterium]|jgi:hypothetical protein
MKYILILLFSFFALLPNLRAQTAININDGAKATNSTTVKLHLFYGDAVEMKIANELAIEDANWQAFQENITWIMQDGDGTRVVSIRFKTSDGSISEHHIASILLDTEKPTEPYVKFSDAPVTNRIHGNPLKISARNGTHMKLSPDADFSNERWLLYDSAMIWNVSAGDGEKKVFVKFKDAVGNESEVASGGIRLDTKAPTGCSFIITSDTGIVDANGELRYTNNKNKTVNLEFVQGDAEFIKISNIETYYESQWTAFRDYYEAWQLPLEGADGKYFVYVKFRDMAGNETKTMLKKLIVDTHIPVDVKFFINENAPITNNPLVKLSIFARGASFMRISETSDFEGVEWGEYSTSKEWELKGEDGIRKLFIEYQDSAQNVTNAVFSQIILDREAPKPVSIAINDGEKRTRDAHVTISVKAEGATQMQTSLVPKFKSSNWITYSDAPFIIAFDNIRGDRKIYTHFRDEARNISESISASIIYESVPVNCDIVIDENASYTIHPKGEVTLTLRAQNASEMLISNHKEFRRANWQPYQNKIKWTLDAGDGTRTIYVKYRSATGTVSNPVSDDIIVDRKGPYDMSVVINKGEKSTFSNLLSVEVKAQDAKYMEISNTPDFKGSIWESYNFYPSTIIVRDGGGWRKIYARFRDETGNVSKLTIDSILVEIAPMDLDMEINKKADFSTAKDRMVDLSIHAQYASEIMIGNQEDFAGGVWEAYKAQKKWLLADEDGVRRVYIKFRSHTGTLSEVVSSFIIQDRVPPINNKIYLSTTRAGQAINPSLIFISVVSDGAAMMQTSNSPEFSSKHWTWDKYSDLTYVHNIGMRKGEVTVWVRFRDESGNISVPVTETIFIDRTAPENNAISVSSATDFGFVNVEAAKLKLFSNDAAEMRVTQNALDLPKEPWIAYQAEFDWKFGGEDGIKYLYVQYKDKTGNISKAIRTSVELDRQPPRFGSMRIVEDYCINPLRIVNLEIKAIEASKMMISNSVDFSDGVWERLKQYKVWQLSDSDGEKAVYIKFADDAENETKVFTDKVILDRVAPVGSITINRNEPRTNKMSTLLQIETGDAKKMRVSDSPVFDRAVWGEPVSNMTWEFGSLDGKKVIYMQLVDEPGNSSTVFVDSISIDTEAPIVRSVVIDKNISAVKMGKKVMLQSKVFGVNFMMISNSSDFSGASWEPYFKEKEWKLEAGEGWRTVYFKFKDDLENESKPFSDNIQVFKKLYHVGN